MPRPKSQSQANAMLLPANVQTRLICPREHAACQLMGLWGRCCEKFRMSSLFLRRNTILKALFARFVNSHISLPFGVLVQRHTNFLRQGRAFALALAAADTVGIRAQSASITGKVRLSKDSLKHVYRFACEAVACATRHMLPTKSKLRFMKKTFVARSGIATKSADTSCSSGASIRRFSMERLPCVACQFEIHCSVLLSTCFTAAAAALLSSLLRRITSFIGMLKEMLQIAVFATTRARLVGGTRARLTQVTFFYNENLHVCSPITVHLTYCLHRSFACYVEVQNTVAGIETLGKVVICINLCSALPPTRLLNRLKFLTNPKHALVLRSHCNTRAHICP